MLEKQAFVSSDRKLGFLLAKPLNFFSVCLVAWFRVGSSCNVEVRLVEGDRR